MNNSKKLSQNALEDFLNKIEISSINNKKSTKQNSQRSTPKAPIEEFLSEISNKINIEANNQHQSNPCVKNCQCKNKNTKCQNCFENNCMLQSYRQGILDGMCFCNQPQAPAPTPEPEPIPEDPIETKTLPISDPKSESISGIALNQQIVNEEFVNDLGNIELIIQNKIKQLIDFLKSIANSGIRENFKYTKKYILKDFKTQMRASVGYANLSESIYDYDILQINFNLLGMQFYYFCPGYKVDGVSPNRNNRLITLFTYPKNNLWVLWFRITGPKSIQFDVIGYYAPISTIITMDIIGIKLGS